MATDCDAPRHTEPDEETRTPWTRLKARRTEAQSSLVDVSRGSRRRGGLRAAGADLSGEDSLCGIVPRRADEFT